MQFCLCPATALYVAFVRAAKMPPPTSLIPVIAPPRKVSLAISLRSIRHGGPLVFCNDDGTKLGAGAVPRGAVGGAEARRPSAHQVARTAPLRLIKWAPGGPETTASA